MTSVPMREEGDDFWGDSSEVYDGDAEDQIGYYPYHEHTDTDRCQNPLCGKPLNEDRWRHWALELDFCSIDCLETCYPFMAEAL